MRRALAALALLVAVLGALCSTPAGAGAGTRGRAGTELERLRDDYDEVLAEEAHLMWVSWK